MLSPPRVVPAGRERRRRRPCSGCASGRAPARSPRPLAGTGRRGTGGSAAGAMGMLRCSTRRYGARGVPPSRCLGSPPRVWGPLMPPSTLWYLGSPHVPSPYQYLGSCHIPTVLPPVFGVPSHPSLPPGIWSPLVSLLFPPRYLGSSHTPLHSLVFGVPSHPPAPPPSVWGPLTLPFAPPVFGVPSRHLCPPSVFGAPSCPWSPHISAVVPPPWVFGVPSHPCCVPPSVWGPLTSLVFGVPSC